MKFRDLKADEIEVRIQSVKPNGLVLLLYKDARCDMNILDETLGAENWQRFHKEIKGNLFCGVSVRVPREAGGGMQYDDWIEKWDCGTESNMEAAKGEASDSFKRACFNLGIGRELYTAPFTWVKAANCNIENGRCYDKFHVEKIKIEDGRIVALSIWNDTMNCRAFVWQKEK